MFAKRPAKRSSERLISYRIIYRKQTNKQTIHPSILITLIHTQGSLCNQEAYKKIDALRLDNNVIQEFKARSSSDCASNCLADPEQCVSFNWKELDKTCRLNNAGRGDFPGDTVSGQNWAYYGVDDSYQGEV